MVTPSRRTLVAAALSVAAALAGQTGAPATAVPATRPAAIAPVPASLPAALYDCTAKVYGVDDHGVMTNTVYQNRMVTTTPGLDAQAKGPTFVPRAFTVAGIPNTGGETSYFYAVAPNGSVWVLTNSDLTPGVDPSAPRPWRWRPVGSGWSTVTAITASHVYGDYYGSPPTYLFALTSTGTLRRYTSHLVDLVRDARPANGRTVPTPARDIKAMTWSRYEEMHGRMYDVLLVTTKDGKLQEIAVSRTAPMRVVRRTLRASTWQVFDSITTDDCVSGGAAIIGTTPQGRAFVYHDSNWRGFAAPARITHATPMDVPPGRHFAGRFFD